MSIVSHLLAWLTSRMYEVQVQKDGQKELGKQSTLRHSPSPDRVEPERTPVRSLWARRITRLRVLNDIADAQQKLKRSELNCPLEFASTLSDADSQRLPRPPISLLDRPDCGPTSPINIGIVGAGISGLYLAMLLDELQIPFLTYDILESSERTGGRVFTYRFGGNTKDYYDVGAMRFPNIPPLRRTIDFFQTIGVKLIPYDMKGENCPHMFNSIRHIPGSSATCGFDPFKMSVSNGGLVPDGTISEGAEAILQRTFRPFKNRLAEDFGAGFRELLKFDHYTMRDYLRHEMGYDFYSIWYLETICSASGLYDQSLSEAVLDSLDFDYTSGSGGDVDWYQIEGGTSQVVDWMERKILRKPIHGKRVRKMSYNEHEAAYPVGVEADGEAQIRKYTAVFNTTSLPCLRRMELKGNILSAGQKAAIQSVHYDSSTKVAVKFKRQWWSSHCGIRGGQASTDLPIRTCVYPSGSSTSTVLLCSYTWGQDAQQLGSLADQNSSRSQSELKQLLIHNLALLHQECQGTPSSPHNYSKMYDIIQNEYESHHAVNWYNDPHSSGAFAYFGPGQFVNFYPELVKPAADGHVYLVGEACSAHHGWIAGALESVRRALAQFIHKLALNNQISADVLQKAWDKLGCVEEIEPEVLEWHVFLGELSKQMKITSI